MLDIDGAIADNGHIRQKAATTTELSKMSNFTLPELKMFVLGNITMDQAREYGDLRKRSTWETAYNECVRLYLDPIQVSEDDMAGMTVDNVDQVPFEPATVPALTWSEVGSIAATTAVATAIVAADHGQVVWTKAKAFWTVTEPVLYQGLFFTVVLAIFFYWCTATVVQKVYLTFEWSVLSLAYWTANAETEPVEDGVYVTSEMFGQLLLNPCEATS